MQWNWMSVGWVECWVSINVSVGYVNVLSSSRVYVSGLLWCLRMIEVMGIVFSLLLMKCIQLM